MKMGLIMLAAAATLGTAAISAPASAQGYYHHDGYHHGYHRDWHRDWHHDGRRDWHRDHWRHDRDWHHHGDYRHHYS